MSTTAVVETSQHCPRCGHKKIRRVAERTGQPYLACKNCEREKARRWYRTRKGRLYHKYAESTRRNVHQAITLVTAGNIGKPWDEKDDMALMSRKCNIADFARFVGRTYNGVKTRSRDLLRRKGAHRR